MFLEYLQFGIKTKEERCYWKKLIYMTAEWGFNERSGANRRVNKVLSYYRYFSKMESARRSEKQRYPVLYDSLKGSVKDWVCLTIADILTKNLKNSDIDSAAAVINDKLQGYNLYLATKEYRPFNSFYNLRGDLSLAPDSVKNNYQKHDSLNHSIITSNDNLPNRLAYRNSFLLVANNFTNSLVRNKVNNTQPDSMEPCLRFSKSTPLNLI